MKRGEIWLTALDPSQGSEAAKTRPCVIVSSDASNTAVDRLQRGTVTVLPLTSNITKIHEFQALIEASSAYGLPVDSKAQAEQIRAVDHTRLIRRMSTLNTEHIAAIEEAIRVHLAL